MQKYAKESMAKRITITLPDTIAEELEAWANKEGRPTANLASFLIQKAVEQNRPKQSNSEEEKS